MEKLKSLTEIGLGYPTDKAVSVHLFTEFYAKYFDLIRDEKINLLEIGIAYGGSLRMWKEYFYNGNIYGIDVLSSSMFEEERISTNLISQTDFELLKSTFKDIKFDIIIDDGSHMTSHQINSFKGMKEFLKPGGYYVVEDLQTSFMPSYIDSNVTAFEFLKNINPDDYGIEYIEFFHNMDTIANVDCITALIKYKN